LELFYVGTFVQLMMDLSERSESTSRAAFLQVEDWKNVRDRPRASEMSELLHSHRSNHGRPSGWRCHEQLFRV